MPSETFTTFAKPCKVALGVYRPAVHGEDGFKQAQTMHQAAVGGSRREVKGVKPHTVAPEFGHPATVNEPSGL